MIICPNPSCGAQNDDTVNFCDQCGTPLTGAPRVSGGSAPAAAYGGGPAAGGASVCPGCGAAIIPGEAFCGECGAQLSSPPPVSPGPYNPPPPIYPPPVAPQPYTPPPAQASARLAAAGQTYTLAGKSSYLIGRTDDVSGIYPEVDTSTTGGMENGVGRKHAEISMQGYQWFIKDLNSVNGTFVNNQRLAPHAPQPLNPGDQIRLGRWSATFQG